LQTIKHQSKKRKGLNRLNLTDLEINDFKVLLEQDFRAKSVFKEWQKKK